MGFDEQIGCATGRSSFELARHFDHVDALDFSARLIQAPTALQSSGIQRYALLDEGDLVSFKEVTIDDLGYQNIRDKVPSCRETPVTCLKNLLITTWYSRAI